MRAKSVQIYQIIRDVESVMWRNRSVKRNRKCSVIRHPLYVLRIAIELFTAYETPQGLCRKTFEIATPLFFLHNFIAVTSLTSSVSK